MKTGIDPLLVVDDGSVNLRDNTYSTGGEKECAGCCQKVGRPHERDCRYWLHHVWNKLLPPCDFRSISRDSDRAVTRVSVVIDPYRNVCHEWIVAGQGNLDRYSEQRDSHALRVYLGRGATDFEHDSAYVLQLELYGVKFHSVSYGCAELTAFISPDLRLEDFCVPKAGYNPFEMEGTVMCQPDKRYHGEDHVPHPIVTEGCYAPKGDVDQLKLIRGKRVRVTFGYVTQDSMEQ